MKYDFVDPTIKITTELNTKDLIQLINTETNRNIQSFITHKEAKSIAKSHGLPTTKTTDKITPGWMLKPKGMMQILYERGFIDPSYAIKDYVEKGLKCKNGLLDKTKGYKLLIANLPDFINEKSMLEYYGEKLGVTVDSSPKYHPEISGEGIEYCWGMSKVWYRKQPLEKKRIKTNSIHW